MKTQCSQKKLWKKKKSLAAFHFLALPSFLPQAPGPQNTVLCLDDQHPLFLDLILESPVKVKVEKSDLKLAWIRTKLDALLQCLPKNSYMGGEHLGEEAWKTHLDAHSKDWSIIATPGKSHLPIFCHSK